MSKFNLYVTKSSSLKLLGQSIALHTNQGTNTFPLTSIQAVMIENPHCTISSQIIHAFLENNIHVWFCDQKHLPAACIMPFNQYYQTPIQLRKQLELTKQNKDRLWQRIIKNKITNQMLILEALDAPEAKILKRYSSGKIANISTLEAWTARIYFKAVFGKDFNRRVASSINSALNYGYALIRSSIAKELASLGIQPSLGIFHNSQKNNFNLADDLLEPFRPLVDYLVWLRQDKLSIELSSADKQYLFAILSLPINSKKCILLDLVAKQSRSFNNFLTSKKPSDLINITPDALQLQELRQWENY